LEMGIESGMSKILDTDNPIDVFLWFDKFWCFREEYSVDFLRDAMPYRVLEQDSPEWFKCTRPAHNRPMLHLVKPLPN
jgi:hypothetical protein